MVVPDDGYLGRAQALLRAHRALLIADEVQTGLARTGKMLCQEWDGARVRQACGLRRRRGPLYAGPWRGCGGAGSAAGSAMATAWKVPCCHG